MDLRQAGAVLLAMPVLACASSGAKPQPARQVDLRPARAAVEEARRAGAPQRVPDIFGQAEGHLKEAEALNVPGAAASESGPRVEILGRLAMAEAGCAADLARRYPKGVPPVKGVSGARGEPAELAARLRRSEERVALLQRELELTETEVIRTKARLQGIETKADASSAIAEARILMGRLDPKDRTTLGRCQELLAKAERQLDENNYGAAVFFARKVQDMLSRPREAAPQP